MNKEKQANNVRRGWGGVNEGEGKARVEKG
jgi:hypothetical protein